VLSGGSTLTLQACTLAQLTVLFERYLLSRPGPPHGFLALASHPADTRSLLELQFLFDVLQKTISLKVPGEGWGDGWMDGVGERERETRESIDTYTRR